MKNISIMINDCNNNFQDNQAKRKFSLGNKKKKAHILYTDIKAKVYYSVSVISNPIP